MYLIEVSPLKNIKGFRSLSYFSRYDFKPGDIVSVPFRNREILAMVIANKSLKSVKTDVKNSDFMPRKIKKQEPVKLSTEAFVQAVLNTAKYLVAPSGQVFSQAVPSALLKYKDRIKIESTKHKSRKSEDRIFRQLLVGFEQERIEDYKALCRRQLALGKDTIIITENMQTARKIHAKLSVGIASMISLFDTEKTPLQIVNQLQNIADKKGAKVIIGTSFALATPSQNLGMIIIEQESSTAFRRMAYPNTDMRILAEYLAKEHNADIVYSDAFLSLRNYMYLYKEEAHVIGNLAKRIRKPTRLRLIDLSKELQYSKDYKLSYPMVSRQIIGEMTHFLNQNSKVFIHVPKKGIAGQTVCNDCAFVLHCPKCKANLKLKTDRKEQKARFFCARCGYSKRSDINCPKCNSWRLVPLGVGIESVHNYIKDKFQGLKIFTVYQDENIKEKTIQENMEEFLKDDTPAILLGTNKALQYLPEDSVEYAASLSPDSLFSIPDFEIEEKVFATLTKIVEKTKERFDIQAKDPDNKTINLFVKKDAHRFIKRELTLREKLMWPPYVVLLKVVAHGSKKEVIENMQKFIELFAEYKPRIFRDFIQIDDKTVELPSLIRIPYELWPDNVEDLHEKLSLLPQSFSIHVNPEERF